MVQDNIQPGDGRTDRRTAESYSYYSPDLGTNPKKETL